MNDPGGVNRLPALAGVALALTLWMAGEAVKDQVGQLQQRLIDANQSVLPRAGQTMVEMEQTAADAKQQRTAIEASLRVTDPAAYMQAKVVQELRQACSAEGIQACAVKYFDDPVRAVPSTADAARSPADKASAASVADLGLVKARAVVNGIFQDAEFRRFIDKLSQRQDPGRWRINGLVVRGSTFEIDVELIIRPSLATEGRTP